MWFVRSFIDIFVLTPTHLQRGAGLRGGGTGRGKRRCWGEPRSGLSDLLSCLREGPGSGNSGLGKCNKWDRYVGVLPWCTLGAAGILDFLQRVCRRLCDFASRSLGRRTFREFNVFWNQFILPHRSVAVSPLSYVCCPKNTSCFS